IASVVSVVALGTGSQQQILENINSLGTNRIDIYPGTGFGDLRSGRVQSLRAGDADELAAQSYIDGATPNVSTNVTLRLGNQSANAQVSGVGEQFFRVRGMKIASGSLFTQAMVERMDQVVVIDQNTQQQFFADGSNPIGAVLLLGNVPMRVIGVTQPSSSGFGASSNLSVWSPYTTVMARMLGQSYVNSITVRVADDTSMSAAESAITRLLTLRHGK